MKMNENECNWVTITIYNCGCLKKKYVSCHYYYALLQQQQKKIENLKT